MIPVIASMPASQMPEYASWDKDHKVSPSTIRISAYRSSTESKKPPNSDVIPLSRARLPSIPSTIDDSWTKRPAIMLLPRTKLTKDSRAMPNAAHVI